MPLFGGDDSAPQSPTSQTSESPTPSPVLRSPQNAQNPSLISSTLDSDEATEEDDELGDGDDDDDIDLELDSDEEPSRPNRFTGKPSTWRGYTATDRQIAASLDRIESEDLAAHLYNAHSLKRRVQRPAEQLVGLKNFQGKESWLKRGEELQYTDPFGELQTELVPSRLWTAWPLPPSRLAATNERVATADSDEGGWYIGSAGAQDAGEIMREETLALFARLAREKWVKREAEEKAVEARDKRKSGVKSRSKSVRTETSDLSGDGSAQPLSDVEMQDGEAVKRDEDPTSQSEPEEKYAHLLGKKGTTQKQQGAKPVLLADDEKAQRLLQPSINSLLARLDNLALSIRRTRLNHFGRGASSDTSGGDFTSDAESITGATSPSRSNSESASSSRGSYASKPKKRPRKKKAKQKSGRDSASGYENDEEEDDATTSDASASRSSQRRRSKSKTPAQQDELSRQFGLIDWSEVLGIASMTGWDERVVARTAQRCATLFGEGMAFRAFDEGLANQPVAEAVHYAPTTIASPEELGIRPASTMKRPFFDVGTLRCPHKDCFGHEKEFEAPYRVVEHVKRTHGYDPRTNDSDNEERTVGGVHIDGFLQPVTAKQGWLGRGRSKSVGDSEGAKRGRKKLKMEGGPETPVPIEDSEP